MRECLVRLIASDWKPEGVLHNYSTEYDLSTILLSVPEVHVKQMVENVCMDIIEKAKEREKAKTFFQKILRLVGIVKDKEERSEMLEAVDNITVDSNFDQNYLFGLKLDFKAWKIAVVTNYSSNYVVGMKNISIDLSYFQNNFSANVVLQQMKISMERHVGDEINILSSGQKDHDFIRMDLSQDKEQDASKMLINVQVSPLILDIKKEIFDEINLFLKFKKRQTRKDPMAMTAYRVPAVMINFDKMLKVIKSNIQLQAMISSSVVRIIIDTRDHTQAVFHTGNIKANLQMSNEREQ